MSYEAKVVSVPLLLVGILADLYFLINGTVVFGSLFNSYLPELSTYLAMDAIMLALIGKTPELNISFVDALIFFVPAFILTTFVMDTVLHPSGFSLATYSFSYYIMQIFLEVFVVALSEEMLFRGLLQKYFGWFGQGILFGLFHLSAYTQEGFGWESIIVAMIFGIAMGYIVKVANDKNGQGPGLAITWGIHSGYNLAIVLGVFTLGGVI